MSCRLWSLAAQIRRKQPADDPLQTKASTAAKAAPPPLHEAFNVKGHGSGGGLGVIFYYFYLFIFKLGGKTRSSCPLLNNAKVKRNGNYAAWRHRHVPASPFKKKKEKKHESADELSGDPPHRNAVSTR